MTMRMDISTKRLEICEIDVSSERMICCSPLQLRSSRSERTTRRMRSTRRKESFGTCRNHTHTHAHAPCAVAWVGGTAHGVHGDLSTGVSWRCWAPSPR